MSESVHYRGVRTGTPVPRIDREQTAKPSLHIEQWGQKQVAEYLAQKYPPTVRAQKKEREVEAEMTVIKMTREEYLAERLAGKKRTVINNELGVSPPTFYKQLGEWGIKEFDAEQRALELLDTKSIKADKPSPEVVAEVKKALEEAAPTKVQTFEEPVECPANTPATSEPIADESPATSEPESVPDETSRLISVRLPVSVELLLLCFDILADDAYQTACDKGWHQRQPHLPTELALIHSEVSEALEADRKDQGHERVAEELADIVIRVMDTARSHKLDVGAALIAKMEKNKSREFRHGNLPY